MEENEQYDEVQTEDAAPVQQEAEGSPEAQPAEERAPIATCSVRMDGAFYRDYLQTARLWLLLSTVFGGLICVVYIVLSVLYEEGILFLPPWLPETILWAGAILFGIGLVFSITLFRSVRKAEAAPILTDEFFFYERDFLINTYRSEEKIAAARLTYAELAKIRERKKFFLLKYNASTVCVVPKECFSAQELAALRSAFLLPPRQ